jgi:alkanesulfonate monooxygenase SsuD/methylene tetrahydromethanopterin reductase-like flavin-dependent oxidoreductase (luciferase family)
MKLGFFFELQLPRPWDAESEHRIYKEAIEQAELADKLGFDYIWAVEHHFLEEYSHCSAPEIFLTACSQRTKNVRLGHGVVLTSPGYNHPARIAERLGALDLVSDGRLDFGSGESSSEAELGGFCQQRSEKREKWREGLEAVCRMMAETPFQGYEGKHFKMPVRNVVPKPLQKPHPPLWLAASKPETINLAAQLGMGSLTISFVPPEEIKPLVDSYYNSLANECAPIGFAVNPNIFFVAPFMTATTQHRLDQMLGGAEHFFLHASSHYFGDGEHEPGRTSLWEKFQENPIDLQKAFPHLYGKPGNQCVGTLTYVRDKLRKFEEAGADQVGLMGQICNYRHEDICEAMELLGREVLPEFKERDARRASEKAAIVEPMVERAMKRKPAPQIPKHEGPTIIKAAGVY